MFLLTVSNTVNLAPVSRLPAAVLGRIKSRLSFQNPAWLDAQWRGFSTWNIPKEITGWGQGDDALIIPRGFTRQMVEILRGAGVQYRHEDRRRTLPTVDFTFLGELHDFQVEAVEATTARDFGSARDLENW